MGVLLPIQLNTSWAEGDEYEATFQHRLGMFVWNLELIDNRDELVHLGTMSRRSFHLTAG